MFLAACVQLHSTTDVDRNLDTAERLVRRAASLGASLVLTPENTPYLGPQFHKLERAEPVDGPSAERLRALAAELKIHLLVGSITERRLRPDGTPDPKHVHNTSLLYGPDGALIAQYRKIHLFDVEVPDGPSIRESDTVVPGAEPVVAETALGRIGMTVCYDLRFPGLYQRLVDLGADLVAVPAAFTLTTGKDHWHALLRARAIETQCWVLAPAQWGRHDAEGRRESYGHSLVVDPWGTVVADRGQGVGLALAEIDPARTAEVRRAIPVRAHRRF